jgi:hypothetical protein
MNLGKDGYNFHTILGMASGRLTPDDLIRMLTEGNAFDKGDSDSSLVGEEKQILYKDKTENRAVNYKSKNEETAEKAEF